MASIGYVLFFSRILTGDSGGGLFTSNLFPNFLYPDSSASLSVSDVIQIRPKTVQDFGKLLVWSFLSGFSERFVENVLVALEKKS